MSIAAEIYEPDAVYCVGLGRSGERHHALARISRQPKPWTVANFGSVEWLPPAAIDPALLALMPRELRAVTPKDVQALEKWFGVTGKFPAVHLESREVRGV